MSYGPLIDNLIDSLQVLPGVGRKTAQRMAMHLLERDRSGAQRLASHLDESAQKIKRCRCCQNLTEFETCVVCGDKRRDQSILCIVESPSDLQAIEQSGHYRGYYFVLMGHLSPLDGLGPEEIGLPKLLERVDAGLFSEVILATNATVEGEATAHYIVELLRDRDLEITRLAQGLPTGGELGYADFGTLNHAFTGRKKLDL